MRYLLVLIDGLADTPLQELGGKTPLESAVAPALDKLATSGRLGVIRTLPRDEPPETLAALFTLLGYPPGPYLTGRGYYEALATGLMLSEEEWCFRLQFVTEVDGCIVDTRAGGLTAQEGRELLTALEKHFKQAKIRFVQGHRHNHLLVVDGVDFNGLSTVSTNNIYRLPYKEHLPEGPGHEVLLKLLSESPGILKKHEVNRLRIEQGRNPANAIWIWGAGTSVDVPGFHKTFGLDTGLVSFSDLYRGVAVAAGIRVHNPGEPVGLGDPSGMWRKVEPNEPRPESSEAEQITQILESTEKALTQHQLVITHFAYPDDHSHLGDAVGKVKSIELMDRLFFKPIARSLVRDGDVRLTIVPTLMCRVETRQHDERPVPFLMWGPGVEGEDQLTWTESNAAGTGIKIDDGTRLIDYVINGL